MTLKELMEVLPAYTTVSVHDDGSKDQAFACQGNPHQFTTGLYKSHGDDLVVVAVPMSPYHIEVTVKEANR